MFEIKSRRKYFDSMTITQIISFEIILYTFYQLHVLSKIKICCREYLMLYETNNGMIWKYPLRFLFLLSW